MGMLLLPQQVSVELYSDIQCKKINKNHGKYNVTILYKYLIVIIIWKYNSSISFQILKMLYIKLNA